VDWHLFAGFVLVTILLGLTPGPNVALIIANSVSHGIRHGLASVAGAFSGLVLQVVAIVCGLAAIVAGLGHWFGLLRWAGVVYLLWLGLRQWRAPTEDLGRIDAQPPGHRRTWRRALVVSCANPKTMLFLGALFPQFVSAAHPAAPQMAMLGGTFLAILGAIDCLWALLAVRARGLLRGRGRLRQRLSGGLLVAAACGLAAANRQ
jgi:homoserine/homoserine lactone efflux protein